MKELLPLIVFRRDCLTKHRFDLGGARLPARRSYAMASARSSLRRVTLMLTALLGAAFGAEAAVGQSTYILATGRRLPYLYAISFDAALDPAIFGIL